MKRTFRVGAAGVAQVNLLWASVAIAVGDEVLRRRASCVTWIEPATPPPSSRPRVRADLAVGHTRDHGGPPWLAPPVRPPSLR